MVRHRARAELLSEAARSCTKPEFALWLKNAGREDWFYIYISLLCLIYLVACIRMRETKIASLIEED